MLIEITYNVTDVFMSTTETPVYVEISFEQPGSASAVWGSITGTLSNQTDLQNALNLKVPYTGATGNVDLGEYELKAGQVEFDQTPTGSAGVGVMRWNDADGTVDLGLKGGNVTLQVGQEQVAMVVNKTGANLLESEYKVVKVSSAQGQRLAVDLAQANNDNNSADTLGIVTENIDNNQEGFITTLGTIRGINTTGSLQGETWTDGDVLYLSGTTAGAITNVKPTAPLHIVVVGYVEYAHQNNGKIFVKVMNGWEIDELHNVLISSPTNNQGLFYNSTSTLWENKSITTALGYTPVPTTRNITINGVTYDLSADRTYTISTGISGSGASGQVTYWTGASAVSGSNNLFWDNTNGRLGIGTNTPTNNLEITRATGTTTLAVTSSGSGLDGRAVLSVYRIASGLNTGWQFLKNESDNFVFRSIVSTATVTERMTMYISTGNIGINTTSDGGQRLQVIGDTLLRGSGNTSATTALTVQNSDGTNMWRFANDGRITIGTSSSIIYPAENINQSGALSISGTGLQFAFSKSTQEGYGLYIRSTAAAQRTNTTGDAGIIDMFHGFAPTSGNGTYHMIKVTGTINQTGGANGITRGLYVNPTLTSAADWRSIEWSNNSGYGLYGAGTAPNMILGPLSIGETSIGSNILNIRANLTGSTIYNSVRVASLALSDVTNIASAFRSEMGTQNATFTLSTLAHFHARQGSLGASSTVTNQYGFWAVSTLTGATYNYGFVGDIPSGTGRWNLYMGGTADNYLAGNLGIGITPTVRLHVSGDTILRGSGATSATTALTVQNSDSTNMWRFLNNGDLLVGTTSEVTLRPNNGTITSPQLSGRGLTINIAHISGTGSGVIINNVNGDRTATSGVSNTLLVQNGFAPTSGTGQFNMIVAQGTINQTGGANGITRGLYVNPTLTSAADFRAIETARGNIVFSNLPTSSAGLPTGALWNDAGTVKIV